jgi:hypothetical protein
MIARKATSEDAENALGKEYALFAIEGLVSSLCRMELFSHFSYHKVGLLRISNHKEW